MPWIVSRWIVVTTVTPVAKRPITWRSARADSSTAAGLGVSLATPAGVVSPALGGAAGGVRGGAGGLVRSRRGGGISPELAVGGATRVRRATPSRSVTLLALARSRFPPPLGHASRLGLVMLPASAWSRLWLALDLDRRADRRGPSAPRPLLLRVIEREAYDASRDSLLQPVQLADLDLRAQVGVLHVHPAQRDRVLQDRAPGSAGHDPHPAAPDIHLVAVTAELVALQLPADQPALRVLLALHQGLAADEV